MPYLHIRTNASVAPESRDALLAEASREVAEGLGKSERYVMVDLEDGRPMRFAGDAAPLAYLALKSIGLPQDATAELSRRLCTLVERRLGIPADRVYVEFVDAPRKMWGWNGGTF